MYKNIWNQIPINTVEHKFALTVSKVKVIKNLTDYEENFDLLHNSQVITF